MIIKWKAYEFTTKRSAEVMIPNMGRGMLSHIVVGAAAVFALALYIPHPVLGAWYALLFLSVLGRLYIIKKWSTHSGDHSKKPFRTSHDALAFLAGLLWGSTSFLALYWANWDVQLLMLILSLGMASGSLATLGGMPQTFYLFAIPTILPHVPAFLLSDHSFSAILATLIFLFLVIILTNGKNYSQRLIGYHAQSEDLKKARDVAEKALLKAEVE
ncbi:hypothetical protein KAI87_07830, partial [Myxococcota bacterium]|nr:hypothetical protein [Myxococcota bacterium]